jgi:hypothetical protein
MKRTLKLFSAALATLLAVTAAQAHYLTGTIVCTNGLAFPNVTVNVTGTNCNGAFSGSAVTDATGTYFIAFPLCDGTYTATVDAGTLPPDAVLSTSSQTTFSLDDVNVAYGLYFTVDSTVCNPPSPNGACWLTSGGAKVQVGRTPEIAFGGNVNPGCSPTAGDGGDWNHIDRIRNLHFHGTSIQVIDCGNVAPPHPPGSTSPVTPFNFIEFMGTGTLKGIAGNKADYGTVYFIARAEDRGEPGSKGAKDPINVDRIYIRVFANPADPFGSTLLVLGGNDLDMANDVVPITDGNLQIHVSSCDNPPTP